MHAEPAWLVENRFPIPEDREAFDFYAIHEFLAGPKLTLIFALLLIIMDSGDYFRDMQSQHRFSQCLILAVLALIVNFLNSNHLTTCPSI